MPATKPNVDPLLPLKQAGFWQDATTQASKKLDKALVFAMPKPNKPWGDLEL